MRWICRMYLWEVPIKYKYFFIKAVQLFLGFQLKRTPSMKEMYRISKFTNLESSTFEKGVLCTPDSFFFIGDYIYFTLNTSSHPEMFLRKGILKICSKFTGKHPWVFLRTPLDGCFCINFLWLQTNWKFTQANLIHHVRLLMKKI